MWRIHNTKMFFCRFDAKIIEVTLLSKRPVPVLQYNLK